MVLLLFAFLALAALVVFLSFKLAKYVDLLDKTTKVSGAFIGGVLLAAVTSLPELFTSLSAVVLLRQNHLVTGNILGSNLINLAILGFCMALMFRGFSKAKTDKIHMITILAALVIYGLIAIPTFVKGTPQLGFINIVSLFIPVVYGVNFFLTPKSEEPSEEVECTLKTSQLVTRFVMAAVLLIAVSISITYVSNSLADKVGMTKTFAGALLLGITTSLPEIVSTVTLCRRGNFNAACGNIAGSNIFNFLILFLADLLSFRSGSTMVYPFFTDGATGYQAMLMLILGAASCIMALTVLLAKTYAPQKKITGHVISITAGTAMTAAYILFLVLSNLPA